MLYDERPWYRKSVAGLTVAAIIESYRGIVSGVRDICLRGDKELVNKNIRQCLSGDSWRWSPRQDRPNKRSIHLTRDARIGGHPSRVCQMSNDLPVIEMSNTLPLAGHTTRLGEYW